MVSHFGSSPLARGLLDSDVDDSGEPGIIPARAGFTGGRLPVPVTRWDHPRSRGVYEASARAASSSAGSSPLARGLPIPFCPTSVSGRIIPARAGFTW